MFYVNHTKRETQWEESPPSILLHTPFHPPPPEGKTRRAKGTTEAGAQSFQSATNASSADDEPRAKHPR